MELLWFKLQRSDYFSCGQGTGALFFRGTAIAYQHRAESFWPLRTIDYAEHDHLCPTLDDTEKSHVAIDDLRYTCMREPGLDYVVLAEAVEGVESEVWHAPIPLKQIDLASGQRTSRLINAFYRYSCAVYR